MILWWSATTGECCEATFGVAESSDGIHFDLVTLEGRPGSGASVDGSSLLIDDDGRRVHPALVSRSIFDAQSQRLCCFHGDEPHGAFNLYNVYISFLTNIVADYRENETTCMPSKVPRRNLCIPL
jgi:hypothetical protein